MIVLSLLKKCTCLNRPRSVSLLLSRFKEPNQNPPVTSPYLGVGESVYFGLYYRNQFGNQLPTSKMALEYLNRPNLVRSTFWYRDMLVLVLAWPLLEIGYKVVKGGGGLQVVLEVEKFFPIDKTNKVIHPHQYPCCPYPLHR